MNNKVLKGLGRVLLEDNPVSEGGLSAHLIKKRFSPAGVGVAMGTVGAINLINVGVQGRNKSVMGRVSYNPGLARMTGSYTSGAVQAMHRASGGNREIFSDMAEEVVRGKDVISNIETYGATPELISALYNMGG
jgi:hypothetical protein